MRHTAVHPTGNHVVYTTKLGDATHKVAQRSSKGEMTTGEKIQCRVDKDKFIVRDDKGKETKRHYGQGITAPQLRRNVSLTCLRAKQSCSRHDLEDRAEAVSPSVVSSAVEIARRIPDHS